MVQLCCQDSCGRPLLARNQLLKLVRVREIVSPPCVRTILCGTQREAFPRAHAERFPNVTLVVRDGRG